MLGFAWMTLRQATEALENGRLEEAQRLLCQPGAQGHKGSSELLQQIAHRYLERGERHLQHDDSVAAWNDLQHAEQIGVLDDAAARLRQALVRRGLAEARLLFDAGEPARAADALAKLRERGGQGADQQLLEEGAKGWIQVRELAGRGEFAQALASMERVRRLLPAIACLDRFDDDLKQASQKFASAIVKLHEAVASENSQEVLALAEQVLALAPQHTEARKARSRAWKVLEASTAPTPRPHLQPANPDKPRLVPSERFLLWIDGIGGYLVCLGARVMLGQAAPEEGVDVPLFADVSRLHAAVTRDAEGYLLEAFRAVQVNGQPAERALLRPGDRVTMGTCCQFLFSQPVPVSGTARLEWVSGHRLPLAIDKVFLMADTLVLGPGEQSHIMIPDLEKPVVLFRQKEGLGVRHAGNLTVDGQPCRERGMLAKNSRVCGDDFALSVEPVGKQLCRTG